ncbi:MAG TPA: DUF1972 domain-containing protein [Candidatus Nanopelagicales bacterium]
MRIAMLGTRGVPAQYGGFETAVQEVGKRLVWAGHDVVVYCRNRGQTHTRYLGMDLVNLPAVRTRSAETLSHTGLSVMHALAWSRPDVAILFNAANAPYLPLLHAADIPVAIHVDGLEWRRAKWGERGAAYYHWAEARSARWSDAVIADSRQIAAHVRRTHGIEATFLAYGAPIIHPPSTRLEEVGLESGRYHLMVARFEPENHVREIVEGYVASACRWPLVVVGDAPYSDRYRAEVYAAAGGNPRVRFLGSIWDQGLLDTLYGHALTYLHGHSVGGTNPSLLRAMGAGAPVGAWDVVFNREVVGGAGAWFSDACGVAETCLTAEMHPQETLARGLAGQRDVSVRYRWDDVAAGYEALADDLVSKRLSRSRPPSRSSR